MAFSTILIEGFVLVSRGGSVAAPETFLNYLVIDRLTGLAIHDGAGIIPNEAFTSTATASSARLLVNTSSIEGFIHASGTGGANWTSCGPITERSR